MTLDHLFNEQHGAAVSRIEPEDFPALIRPETPANAGRVASELALAAALISSGASYTFDEDGVRRSRQRERVAVLLNSVVHHGAHVPPPVLRHVGQVAVRTLATLENLGYGEACIYGLTVALVRPDVRAPSHVVRGKRVELDGEPAVLFDRYIHHPGHPGGPDTVKFIQSAKGWRWTTDPLDHTKETDLDRVRAGEVEWRPLDVGARPTVPAFVDVALTLAPDIPLTGPEVQA